MINTFAEPDAGIISALGDDIFKLERELETARIETDAVIAEICAGRLAA